MNINAIPVAALALLSLAACTKQPEAPVAAASAPASATASAPVAAAPSAAPAYPGKLLWGDQHVHTGWSADAGLAGTTLGPEDAVRFARGEPVKASNGEPAQLQRALDWVAVADHSDGMGTINEMQAGNAEMLADATVKRWHDMMAKGGKDADAASREAINAQAAQKLPKVMMDPKWTTSAWEKTVDIMEKYNEPGKFTAFIAYEWTSNGENGQNLHRNVLFRDGKDRADQILPFSAWQSEDPEKLWAWMDAYEKKTGGKLLAIPHNANLSNGRMFEPVDFAGRALTKDYAERRARFEVLQEMVQTKGASETHPLLSPNDEFAAFGTAGWEYGNLTLEGKPLSKDMMPTNYLRSGLAQGMAHEQKLGVNPFKFGIIGGTDVHNSLTAIEEDNFYGKHVNQEPSPNRWEHVSKQGFGKTRYTYHYMAAGYAAVWATDNTREALWDAMKRKEVYATSGTRMTVRFFGGYDYTADDAKTRYLAERGYAKGVPMGGDLTAAAAGKAPTFLVAALKDPIGGNLDRIQIVKAWVDSAGKTQEKIYNVAWSGGRKPNKDGKLAAVGDTVDVANATWTNTIGASELAAVWKDPDFKPTQRAVYYARVIEIPTPTWLAYDQLRFGVKMPKEVPMKHQERAWTSPIWYSPS